MKDEQIAGFAPGPLGAPPNVFSFHVVRSFENSDGVFGPWFSAQNGFTSQSFRLVDEGLTWIRCPHTDAELTALRAAYALGHAV